LGASFTEQLEDFGERFREAIGRLAEGSGLAPGKARWIPFAGDEQPYGAVAVALGRERGSADPALIGAAITSSLRVAVRELRKRSQLKGQRLRIAVPAVGTGHGGMRQMRLEAAEAAMRAAVEAVRRHDQLDLVFVTYKPDTYEIYLQARENTDDAALPSGGKLPDHLVEALRSEECALFVGAGLSQGAGLPGWGELIRKLAKKANIPARKVTRPMSSYG
jgi:hypothetical protein